MQEGEKIEFSNSGVSGEDTGGMKKEAEINLMDDKKIEQKSEQIDFAKELQLLFNEGQQYVARLEELKKEEERVGKEQAELNQKKETIMQEFREFLTRLSQEAGKLETELVKNGDK